MCQDLTTFQVYLDGNASINIFPVEIRPAHKYLNWVFPLGVRFISETTTPHVKSHWRFAQIGLIPNNFGLVSSHCYFGALYSVHCKQVV